MPKCSECPVREFCAVAGTERAAALPTRAAPKPRRVEQRTVYVAVTNEKAPRVLLHKRPAKGLLSGLWELPNLLTDADPVPFPEEAVVGTAPLGEAVHVFSHVEWRMQGYLVKVKPFAFDNDHRLVTAAELEAYALPTAFRAFMTEIPRLLGVEEDV
jgi:A/G-specific adenine glycosylase